MTNSSGMGSSNAFNIDELMSGITDHSKLKELDEEQRRELVKSVDTKGFLFFLMLNDTMQSQKETRMNNNLNECRFNHRMRKTKSANTKPKITYEDW